MKKLNVLVMAILAIAMGFMTSCNQEETDYASPTVTFTQGNQEVGPGTAVVLTYEVLAPGKIDKIVFFKGDASFGDNMTSGFTTDTTHSGTVTISADLVTETFVFDVQVTDKEGQLGKGAATVTVTEDVGTIKEFTVTLGDQHDSEGSFHDLLTNSLYGINDAPSHAGDISLLYYWGNAGLASLYSPQGAVDAGISNFGDLGTWSSRQTTKLAATTDADYDAATYVSLGAGAAGASDQGVTNLSVDDLIYFKLDDGTCGLLKIGTIVPDAKGGVKEIDLSYKIQDEAPASK